jgi:hypothetical protein
MGCPWATTGRAMIASAARIFVDVSWHPPNHRCSPKVRTPINRAACGDDSASREGARSGSKVRFAILVSHYMFIRYRKLISNGFRPRGVAAKIACRAAPARILDEMHSWLARWTMPGQARLPLAYWARLDRLSLASALPIASTARLEPPRGLALCSKSMSPLSGLPLDRTQRADWDVCHRVRASRRGTGHRMEEAL